MGVYFALQLHNTLDIPVGIVGTYWGGTNIDAWTPRSGTEFRVPETSFAWVGHNAGGGSDGSQESRFDKKRDCATSAAASRFLI